MCSRPLRPIGLPIYVARRSCDGKHFISARKLPASLRFFSAEFLETRIPAERVPDRIDLKIAAGYAIWHFEKMLQSGDGRIHIAKLCLDNCQSDFGERFG